MTLREVDIAMSKINVRKHNDLATQARLSYHGFKIPYKKSASEVEEETEESKELDIKVEALMKKAIERKKWQTAIQK